MCASLPFSIASCTVAHVHAMPTMFQSVRVSVFWSVGVTLPAASNDSQCLMRCRRRQAGCAVHALCSNAVPAVVSSPGPFPAGRILPMSETARQHTADSFSEALRGVFQSALKLAVFHAVFTWLTFRAFSIQLVYVSTVASAVCSMLPLVQVWMVAIPAALQLLLQVSLCVTDSSLKLCQR